MKLYAYRRVGKIEFETCQLPPEAHVQQVGTIEVTEPGKEITLPTNGEIDKMLRHELEAPNMQGLEVEAFAEGFKFARGKKLGRPKPKEPIKMTIPIVPPDDAQGTFSVRLELPVEAKNIRCTYEVEEWSKTR